MEARVLNLERYETTCTQQGRLTYTYQDLRVVCLVVPAPSPQPMKDLSSVPEVICRTSYALSLSLSWRGQLNRGYVATIHRRRTHAVISDIGEHNDARSLPTFP